MDMLLEPWHWFVLGIVLILFELFITTFAILWFGIAAIMVSISLCIFPEINFITQIVIWIILSFLCLFSWFKWINPMLKDQITDHISKESVIGQIGLVTEHQIQQHIHVRFRIPLLGSDEWFCRCSQPIKVGDQVKIIDIIGNTFIVEPYFAQQNTE